MMEQVHFLKVATCTRLQSSSSEELPVVICFQLGGWFCLVKFAVWATLRSDPNVNASDEAGREIYRLSFL